MLIVNGERNLFREFENILVPGHSKGAFWVFKYLEIGEMILRAQQSALEVRHEETSVFQE